MILIVVAFAAWTVILVLIATLWVPDLWVVPATKLDDACEHVFFFACGVLLAWREMRRRGGAR